MPGITDLSTFVVGAILIVLLPGPNSIYVISVAARRGVRAGYAAACGVFVGDAVLMTLSAVGAAGALTSSPLLFSIVKYAGAAYLAWLALGMLRSVPGLLRRTPEQTRQDVIDEAPMEAPQERPFRKALVVSLLNPKAILFFIAFFVQFVDPSYAYPALAFLELGLIVQAASFVYLSALIFGGVRLAQVFRDRKALAAGGTSIVGAAFIGFAVKLSLASA
ncbi:leucine efflux protein LeuE [Aeromicrobium sp. IC_218]|uniref:leucine efflux protein LeuE n=1 Tax=Aeromicrobium sp. IC_218 TaxID=2545468 RepID=UPI001038A83D|nr:leucine efflux protein LeuE [Aeromicrobium sp. IC_218]TCI98977.1 leucine efflux protein LeuE [Aeromicrobium sp. IC_218]